MSKPFPGNCATPQETAIWMASVAEEEFGLPGLLPVMCSCVELTSAWTSTGCLEDVPGYLSALDYDSLGLFQQRPSQGWGTPEQLIDAEYALRAFCKEAIKYKGQFRVADPDELGAWCQAVQRSAYPDAYADKGYPIAKNLLEVGEDNVVTAQDIVDSAYKLLWAPYRTWYSGMSIPTWLDDEAGDPPPVPHLKYYGVNCSDLVNFALQDNGLPPGYGTLNFADYLVNTSNFDPDTPGEPGAICLAPYQSPVVGQQGHMGIYVDEHTIIQAIHNPGVTDQWTDSETYYWGGDTAFSTYGFLPGVTYEVEEEQGEEDNGTEQEYWYLAVTKEGWLQLNGPDWSNGWWDSKWVFHRT